MSPLVTYALVLFLALNVAVLLVELVVRRAVRRVVLQLVALAVVVLVLHVTTGFPETREAFGSASPVLVIAGMLVCTVLGTAAEYVFRLKGPFRWRAFLKPVCISPIVLLPLIGSVQSTGDITSVQIISICFLAFQNGFFWRIVLDHAKTKV